MSCCRPFDSNNIAARAACAAGAETAIYSEGCETQIQSYFWVIGGVGIAILVIEVKKKRAVGYDV